METKAMGTQTTVIETAVMSTQSTTTLPTTVQAIWTAHCPEADPYVDGECIGDMEERAEAESDSVQTHESEEESQSVETRAKSFEAAVIALMARSTARQEADTQKGIVIAPVDSMEIGDRRNDTWFDFDLLESNVGSPRIAEEARWEDSTQDGIKTNLEAKLQEQPNVGQKEFSNQCMCDN